MGNWQDSQQGDTQIIEIQLTRGVVMALGLTLFVAMVLGYLVWSEREAAAAGAQSISVQSGAPAKYYLSTTTTAGNGVLTACATGYHTASLWEILDVSNLEYNSALGWTNDDSGSGPPTGYPGWVRTGYASSSSITPGQGNCNVWTTTNGSYYGTSVRLPTVWTAAAEQTIPWESDYWGCNTSLWVWCVED